MVRLTDVEEAYEGFSGRFPGVSVSPLQDAYTETVALAWVVEVKQPGRDMNEATIQLAILHAAVLRKLRSLMVLTGVQLEMSSLVGWVVVGHKWECFVTSMAADGAIVSLCLGFQGSRLMDGNYSSARAPWSISAELLQHWVVSLPCSACCAALARLPRIPCGQQFVPSYGQKVLPSLIWKSQRSNLNVRTCMCRFNQNHVSLGVGGRCFQCNVIQNACGGRAWLSHERVIGAEGSAM